MSRRGWFLFLSLGLIWGLPYLLIKVGVESLSPFVVVFARLALGGAIMLPIAIARGQLRLLAGHWRWVFVFAFVELSFTFLALTWAEKRITSSLAALVIATVPLTAAIIARIIGLESRLSGMRLVGLGVGLAGVGALVGLDVTGGDMLSVAALSITVLGYALGPIIVDRKLSDAPSMAVIGVSLTVNALIYLPFAILNWPTEPVPATAWWSITALGAVCTAGAFIIFFALIAEVGPTRTTVITYINPGVALLLGVLILHEPLTPGILVGFPLVLAGSYLATRRGPTVESEPHA